MSSRGSLQNIGRFVNIYLKQTRPIVRSVEDHPGHTIFTATDGKNNATCTA